MLMSLNTRLRRNRQWVACALAVLALGFFGLAAHSALINSSKEHHMSGSAAVCLVVGCCALFIGVAAFAARRLLQRPMGLIAVAPTPTFALIPFSSGFLVRAGPPPVTQVFRL
jgi:hypothetical protein